MIRYHAGSTLEIGFYRRLARALLVAMIDSGRETLVKVAAGAAGAPRCVISQGQAQALLSWRKSPGGAHAVGPGCGPPLAPWSIEGIDTLASVVAQWEETLDSFGHGEECARMSSLARYRAMVGDPRGTRVRDRASWRTIYESVLRRGVWALAHVRLQAARPAEAWRLAPHAAAQQVAWRESRTPQVGPVPDLAEWARERRERELKALSEAIGRLSAAALPRGPQASGPGEALELASELVRAELGARVPEAQLAAQADVSARNVALELGLAFPDNPSTPAECARLLSVTDPVGAWVLGPLTRPVEDESVFDVFFPISLNAREAFGDGIAGVALIDRLPDQWAQRLALWAQGFGLFLHVKVRALTAELARRQAARRADSLFDVLFGLDGEPLMRRFDPTCAAAADGRGNAEAWGPRPRGRPHTRADAESVRRNAEGLATLHADPRSWCRQLARTLHLLRLGGESLGDETRFLHVWLALESLVGHLTAIDPAKRRRSIELLVLARCAYSSELAEAEGTSARRRVFEYEKTELCRSLDPVMTIRNRWSFHPGDESGEELLEVDPETLERACEWLREECLRLFYVMVNIALTTRDVASRDDVHRHLCEKLNLATATSGAAERRGCLAWPARTRRQPGFR